MRRVPLLLLVSALALTARPSVADESGYFVFVLGNDTTRVEHYTRKKDRLEVDQISRSLRVLRLKSQYEYAGGAITRFSVVATPPGSDTPTQVIEAKRDGDSLRVSTRTGENPAVASAVALPAGVLVLPGFYPWAAYEGESMKLAKSRSDTLGGRVYFIGAANTERWLLKKLGRDSVSFWLSPGGMFHVRVDKMGRFLGSRPVFGTFQFALSRPATLDMDAYAASYRAREQRQRAR